MVFVTYMSTAVSGFLNFSERANPLGYVITWVGPSRLDEEPLKLVTTQASQHHWKQGMLLHEHVTCVIATVIYLQV